ncbi:PREDICTED: cingulin-like [Papilio xuthus]|uniref:Cingulin-like n=1 Tax=Papilio xuthus TaxID=66420 RepID=A0AAJ7EDQ1_PAPXU|nr:PREDICTED: cingulin-like [Papilio xuthus]
MSTSSQQNNQMKICVLKSNLEEIGNELIIQNSTIPALDDENECKYRETMGVVQVLRAITTEIEIQNEESSKLTAKRRQLQLNCEEMTKSINKELEIRNKNENQLQQVENEIEEKIRSYEALLREKADRFRKMHNVYDEIEMKKQLETVNEDLIKITTEEGKQQNVVKDLEKELAAIVPDLPDNILSILRKTELENKLKTLTDKCNEKRDTFERLQKKQKYGFEFNIY